MNGKKKWWQNFTVVAGVLVLVAISLAVVFDRYFEGGQPVKNLSYSELLTSVAHRNVKDITVDGESVEGHFRGSGANTGKGASFRANIVRSESFWKSLEASGADINVLPVNPAGGAFSGCFSFMFLVFLIFMFLQQFRGGGGMGGPPAKLFNFGDRERYFEPKTVNVTFDDVAGLEEVKQELSEIVEYLKNPERFKKLGARIPRGILLSGDPGNGKTLLARAVAGEASCGFFSISGSDFIEIFVGVGASRVRKLFERARKKSPCIVFIDEIDAVGRKRGSGMSGANDERDQTLNQLLAEMDGFSTQPGAVIVLAATNRPDVLDNALLRPGRFDRKVEVPHPDISSREKILKVHSKGVPLDEDVDLEILSRGTPGFSGADLQNLVNEAALNAARGKKKRVSMQDFEAAQDKIILGTARGSMIRTDEEREKTAYHEAGHTLINVLLPQSDPFHKVTIIPRGRALGVSVSLPARDVYSKCPEELRARIMIAFGGMAAEKLKYNKAETGVASDLEQATRVARTMVEYYGMSDMGPMSFSHKLREQWHFSEAVSAKIDAAAEKILQDTYDEAAAMLKEHSDKLELLAQKLLEKETLFASEVYQLLGIEPREFVSFVDRSHPEEPSEDDSSEDEDGLVAAS